ncbi:MAG: cytochrome c biogenesis protein CcsA, partial [Mucispirillum sp.]|nr:cytochrome c biogenesis protein CcsA [Mucispirillum sp.]
DDNSSFGYEIFMNNVLDYKGYRFFQSSYDPDEMGTIFSVNKDPGKIPTYIGYFLLTVGFILSFFGKGSRVWRLSHYLKKQKLYVYFIAFSSFLLLSASNLYAADNFAEKDNWIEVAYASDMGQSDNTAADEHITHVPSQEDIDGLIKNISENMQAHSEKAGRLLVQDMQGRIKPLDTLAMDMVHKLIRKDSLKGMNHVEIFLGMMMYYDYFQHIKMFSTSSEELREKLGTPKNEKYVSFADAYDENGEYKLKEYINTAYQSNPAHRTKFQKDLIKFDEKMGLAYYMYTAQMFLVFPDITGKTTGFLSPGIAMASFDKENTLKIQDLLQKYFESIDKGLKENNWQDADKYLGLISEFQRINGAHLIPAESRISVEIMMNKYNPFKNLTYLYVLLGIVMFIFVITAIIKNKAVNKTAGRIFTSITILAVVLHTAALICRWYIAGHAPWSNAYESMIYIAWAGALAGLLFFQRSLLAIAATNFVAGITLFVANLGFMDPQIGTLVPVLKSYWLNIHVSVITASYSFFGLCFVLGIISMVLFILRSPKRAHIDQSIINVHCINEISMILGLGLLTIGTFLGGVWANESWGRYWGWDPKETWSLITVVAYTIILHARLVRKLNNPYIFSVLSTLGFYTVMMTYFGVNYYLTGMHSYASGEPVPVPAFLYVMAALHILLIAVSFMKRKLNMPPLSSDKNEE